MEDDTVRTVKDVSFPSDALDVTGKTVAADMTDENQTMAKTGVIGKGEPVKTPLHVTMKPNSFVWIEIQ